MEIFKELWIRHHGVTTKQWTWYVESYSVDTPQTGIPLWTRPPAHRSHPVDARVRFFKSRRCRFESCRGHHKSLRRK